MIRQTLLLLTASVLAALGASYINKVLNFFVTNYHTLHDWLGGIFAHGEPGTTLTDLLALFLIPMIITGAISLGYWFIRRAEFPYFAYVLWSLWLVITTAVLITTY